LRLVGPSTYDPKTNRYLGALEGTFRVAYGGQESNDFTIELPPEGIVPSVPRDLGAVIQTDSLLYQLRYTFGIYQRDLPIHVSMYNPRAMLDGSIRDPSGWALHDADRSVWRGEERQCGAAVRRRRHSRRLSIRVNADRRFVQPTATRRRTAGADRAAPLERIRRRREAVTP